VGRRLSKEQIAVAAVLAQAISNYSEESLRPAAEFAKMSGKVNL